MGWLKKVWQSSFFRDVSSRTIAAILATGILAGLTAVWAFMPSVRGWCGACVSAVCAWFAVEFLVQRWLLFLLPLAGVLAVALVRWSWRKWRGPPPKEVKLTSDHTFVSVDGVPADQTQDGYAVDDYTEDLIEGLVCRWEMRDGVPFEVTPYCPKCDHPFDKAHRVSLHDLVSGVPRDAVSVIACKWCGQSVTLRSSFRSLCQGLRHEVERKIRNNEWQAVVEKKTAAAAPPVTPS